MAEEAAGAGTAVARQGPARWTDERKAEFVELVRELGSFNAACRRVGLHRSSVWEVRNRDQAFSDACYDAAWSPGATAPEPPRDPPRKFRRTAKDKTALVEALILRGDVKSAADSLNVRLIDVFAARDADPRFAAALRRARSIFVETAEGETFRLAVEAFRSGRAAPGRRPADAKAIMAMAETVKAALAEAGDVASDGPAGEERDMEAVRLELEQRLLGMVEQWGDPFGDDPSRPLLLPAPANVPGDRA